MASVAALAFGVAVLPAAGIAQEAVAVPCGVLVQVEEVTAALSRTCAVDVPYAMETEEFTFEMTRIEKGVRLKIRPRNLVFLNGENEVVVPRTEEGMRLAIYDSFRPDYDVDRSNVPVGYVTGWSGQ